MKYTIDAPPARCFMTKSTWYTRETSVMLVKGVLWHSTGANNPYLKRYVQPDDDAPDRAEWLNRLGTNLYRNDWNHQYRQAGVQAWVGKLNDGTVAAVQVGPWNKRTWGCGSGSKGSCNDGWIQFEICEDMLTDPVYFRQAYQEAVALTAYLCRLYNLDPLGTVKFRGVDVPVILCHQDSYRLGLGSNHGDVYNWFNKHGKTMQDVRNDVAALLEDDEMNIEKLLEEMTDEQAYALLEKAQRHAAALPLPTSWAAEEELREAVELGITDGTKPMALATRLETAVMTKRTILRAK